MGGLVKTMSGSNRCLGQKKNKMKQLGRLETHRGLGLGGKKLSHNNNRKRGKGARIQIGRAREVKHTKHAALSPKRGCEGRKRMGKT